MDAELNASLVRYAGGALLERHSHGAAGVSIVLAGSIEEEVGSRTELGRVGSIVTKPAGLDHRNRVGSDGAILLAIKGREADDIAAHGWRWTQSRSAAALGLRVARSLKRHDAVDAEQLLELLTFASSSDRASVGARTPTWIDEVRSRIDRECAPTPVARLAALVGVHPVYLARAFRVRFGCSIREYRRKERVRRAANLLATCELPIVTIAAALGFFDQSHLCRDFRAELNVSPRDYRAIIRA